MGRKLTDAEQLARIRLDLFFRDRARDKARAVALGRFTAAVQKALASGLGPVELVGIIRETATDTRDTDAR